MFIKENKDILLGFPNDYPGMLNGNNLADILKAARAKKQKKEKAASPKAEPRSPLHNYYDTVR